jgi:hypothetical protein
MKQIWKYQLETAYEQTILMPSGAKILSLQVQNEIPCIWALVTPDNIQDNAVKIITFGTGHPITGSADLAFIGTYQLYKGTLVFHVFQEK